MIWHCNLSKCSMSLIRCAWPPHVVVSNIATKWDLIITEVACVKYAGIIKSIIGWHIMPA